MFLAISIPLLVVGQASQESDENQLGAWPRTRVHQGHEIVVYQPQFREWPGYERVLADAAVSVAAPGAAEPVLGVVELSAATRVDRGNETVEISQPRIDAARFAGVAEEQAQALEQLLRGAVHGERTWTVPLYSALGAVERAERQRDAEVNLEPPPIFRSEGPAVLLQFLGPPAFRLVEGVGLYAAVNTNWNVFRDPALGSLFLLVGEGWLTATTAKGPWVQALRLPSVFNLLPSDDRWSDVRRELPGRKLDPVPRVFVSERPAELILTEGAPALEPIAGKPLLWVRNTESDLFLHSEEGHWYFLVTGRWFRAESLDGPWSSASHDLPTEFADIPPDHPKASVLASVPGTVEAEIAVLMASLPARAVVMRKELSLEVVYDGEPRFEPIPGTEVETAVNTTFNVFRVADRYFCCQDAVWFTASEPGGPWSVCESVPDEIYTIPPSSPQYNVTYVYVVDSTPDTVVVSSTAGYWGTYVSAGLLVYGACWWWDEWDDGWYYHCHGPWYGYGGGAWYDYDDGVYKGGGHAYGPYGGAGWNYSYDSDNGKWRRESYAYGPYGKVEGRAGYDPKTNTWGRAREVSTPYAEWGRGVAVSDEGWARGGYHKDSSGTAGAIRVGTDKGTFGIAKGKNDDLFVGKDGQVYKREPDGSWSKREGGNWQTVEGRAGSTAGSQGERSGRARSGDAERPPSRSGDGSRPAPGDRARSRSGSGGERAAPSGRSAPAARSHSRAGVFDRLNRDARARRQGSRSMRTTSYGGRAAGRGGRRGRR